MPLSRVERLNLSQTVSSRLSRAILAGEFAPGSRISEPTLSARLGVSRAPIREALIELELRGLVEFDPTGHTRVPSLSPRDIDEIYTVRLMIDPVTAALAAQHAKADTFKALESNVAATKSAKTLADVSRLDVEFHDKIVRAAGNRRLLLCWNVLRDQVGLWLAGAARYGRHFYQQQVLLQRTCPVTFVEHLGCRIRQQKMPALYQYLQLHATFQTPRARRRCRAACGRRGPDRSGGHRTASSFHEYVCSVTPIFLTDSATVLPRPTSTSTSRSIGDDLLGQFFLSAWHGMPSFGCDTTRLSLWKWWRLRGAGQYLR